MKMSCLRFGQMFNKLSYLSLKSLKQTSVVTKSSFKDCLLPSNTSIVFRLLNSSSRHLEKFYSEDHEWVEVVDGVATIGISDNAQKELGEVVFCELPEVGEEFSSDDVFGTVESVKAASDLIMPISGAIVECNDVLNDTPALINSSPEDQGWIAKVKMSDPSEVDNLMTADQYKNFLE